MAVLSFVLALALLPSQLPAADVAPVAAPAAPVAAPAEVVLSGFQWGRVEKTYVEPGGNMWRQPRRRRRGEPPPPVIIRRETYALVKNNGKRTVKSVTWNYVFYSDVARQHEVKRFQFVSREKISPGQMKFITQDVGDSAPTSFDSAAIERIEFEDGTVWQRPAA